MAEEKKFEGPSVLVLGGSGFIGRNFVKYLIDNDCCGSILVTDKSLPVVSYFSKEHEAAMKHEKVKFQQSDLTRDQFMAKVFCRDFDVVVNLCGETRFGLTDQDYTTKIETTAQKCVDAAKAMDKPPKWIEVSTAQVYAGDKKLSDEAGKVKPWTKLATSRLVAENIVKESGLDHVILRPAIVYGHGDLTGLTPRLIVGSVFKYLKEKVMFLWGESLGLQTVHVEDVCAAIWTCAGEDVPSGSLFNLADESAITQGQLNLVMEELFGIKTGYYGSIKSNLAKTQLSTVADMANDKHIPAWTKLCNDQEIKNTPLSPYIDKELLKNNSMLVNGTAITEKTSFKYKHPKLTTEGVAAQLKGFIEQGIFPPEGILQV